MWSSSAYQVESRGETQKTLRSIAYRIQKYRSVREQVADRFTAEMADLAVVSNEIEDP